MRGYLDETTKEISPINQIEAENLGLPDYEFDVAYNGKLYLKGFAPDKPLPTNEEISQIRAGLYREQVDPLMSEYQRKKQFNNFEDGEEEELLEKIRTLTAKIKEENPYN